MDISQFKFNSRQINPVTFEHSIINPDGVKFICSYQSRQPAPNAAIFDEFKKNPKQFFIEVPSKIVTDKPIIDLEVIKTEITAPTENKVTEISVDTPPKS